MKQYLIDSARTVPPEGSMFHTELVPKSFLLDQLWALRHIAPEIDAAKKGLFYGKDTDSLSFTRNVLDPVYLGDKPYENVNKELVHALLGNITEALELAELLGAYLRGEKSEEQLREKLINESGDELWYLALLFRTIGTTFEEVGSANTEKLKIRFPDKFTEALAINRDESKEDAAFQQT